MTKQHDDTVTIEKNGQSYTGVPYKDFKTFNLWRKAGYKVKKGMKSVYKSISFPKVKDKKTGEEKSFPKTYHLFHLSQVERV